MNKITTSIKGPPGKAGPSHPSSTTNRGHNHVSEEAIRAQPQTGHIKKPITNQTACLYCLKSSNGFGLGLESKEILYDKHFEKFNFYFAKPINEILANIRTSHVLLFKDYLFYDDDTEFLKRKYTTEEAVPRIKALTEFYATSYKETRPNTSVVEVANMLRKRNQKLEKIWAVKYGLDPADQLPKTKRDQQNSDDDEDDDDDEPPKDAPANNNDQNGAGAQFNRLLPSNFKEETGNDMLPSLLNGHTKLSFDSHLHDIYNPERSSESIAASINQGKDQAQKFERNQATPQTLIINSPSKEQTLPELRLTEEKTGMSSAVKFASPKQNIFVHSTEPLGFTGDEDLQGSNEQYSKNDDRDYQEDHEDIGIIDLGSKASPSYQFRTPPNQDPFLVGSPPIQRIDPLSNNFMSTNSNSRKEAQGGGQATISSKRNTGMEMRTESARALLLEGGSPKRKTGSSSTTQLSKEIHRANSNKDQYPGKPSPISIKEDYNSGTARGSYIMTKPLKSSGIHEKEPLRGSVERATTTGFMENSPTNGGYPNMIIVNEIIKKYPLAQVPEEPLLRKSGTPGTSPIDLMRQHYANIPQTSTNSTSNNVLSRIEFGLRQKVLGKKSPAAGGSMTQRGPPGPGKLSNASSKKSLQHETSAQNPARKSKVYFRSLHSNSKGGGPQNTVFGIEGQSVNTTKSHLEWNQQPIPTSIDNKNYLNMISKDNGLSSHHGSTNGMNGGHQNHNNSSNTSIQKRLTKLKSGGGDSGASTYREAEHFKTHRDYQGSTKPILITKPVNKINGNGRAVNVPKLHFLPDHGSQQTSLAGTQVHPYDSGLPVESSYGFWTSRSTKTLEDPKSAAMTLRNQDLLDEVRRMKNETKLSGGEVVRKRIAGQGSQANLKVKQIKAVELRGSQESESLTRTMSNLANKTTNYTKGYSKAHENTNNDHYYNQSSIQMKTTGTSGLRSTKATAHVSEKDRLLFAVRK